MYTYLTNKVYLYLLAEYQGQKISYSEIGRALGMSRQTVSKRIKDLEKNGLIKVYDDNTFKIKDDLHLNKAKVKELLDCGYSHYVIGYLLLKDIQPTWCDEQICRGLNCSLKIIENYRKEVKEAEGGNEKKDFIYAIIQNQQITYVGSTDNLEQRICQHIAKRSWLKVEDFIILEKCSIQDRFNRERYYIKLFHPEWNIASNQ